MSIVADQVGLVSWLKSQIDKKPGVTSVWLFNNRPKHCGAGAHHFDLCLGHVRESGYRTANGCWWKIGAQGAPRSPRPAKPAHPKQTEMFGAVAKR